MFLLLTMSHQYILQKDDRLNLRFLNGKDKTFLNTLRVNEKLLGKTTYR